jgi:hypothetical protein
MRKLALLLLAAAVVAAPARAAERPVSGKALLAIDGAAGFRNYLPTLMLPGYRYASWSYKGGVLRVVFRNPAGRTIVWTVAPMRGTCDRGKQKSFQLAGNKVWWAQGGGVQRSWRCVFGQDGKPLRLTAASTTPPTKLADVGLGRVAASAKRY